MIKVRFCPLLVACPRKLEGALSHYEKNTMFVFPMGLEFLRLCSAVLLLTPVLVMIVVAWKSEPWKPGEVTFDPFVCGRISGEVYKFSRLYFPFWPEYEGKSSFDPGFIYNKKGCDANLVSVFLSMTWPELEPADDSLVFRQGLEHEGLLVAVGPITAREGDLRRQLEFLLRKSPAETITLAEYDESSSLYRVEARDTILKITRSLSIGRVSSMTWLLWGIAAGARKCRITIRAE